MIRTAIARTFCGALLLSLAWYADTQSPSLLALRKIKADLYEIEGDGGNVAVFVTGEGVILVDDKFDQDHQGIVDIVKDVTNQPIKYIINTHYHRDHSGGNAKFLPMAEIISTAMARTSALEHREADAPPDVVPARITFTTETSVFLGGKEVRAYYFGRGHTDGDAVIYFPELHTIHTGDLMAGTTPLMDYNAGGSLVEWTKTLDKAMELEFDTVIPGHGPLTTKSGVKAYRDNAAKLRDRVTELVRQGKSQDQIERFMETEYQWGSLQKRWSVAGMIKELR
jgi:glyoxylase-like metal-dependent hydrolase (beta-lactamase superfamily II)